MLEDDGLFKQWLGKTLSQPKHEMDLAPVEPAFSQEQIANELAEPDTIFERVGGTRAIYQLCENELLVSINGDNFTLPIGDIAAVKLLTDETEFNTNELANAQNSLVFVQMFTILVNEGIWFNANQE